MPVPAVIVLLLVFAIYGLACVHVGAWLTWCKQQQQPPAFLPEKPAPVQISGGEEAGDGKPIDPPRSRL